MSRLRNRISYPRFRGSCIHRKTCMKKYCNVSQCREYQESEKEMVTEPVKEKLSRKRIWFTQQAPFNFMPLRAGLGLITDEELREYGVFYGSEVKEAILKMHQRSCPSLADFGYNPDMLCQKIYTTRTHRLSGKYVVVEGSRFKAKPVEPRIEFRVIQSWELSLKLGLIYPWHTLKAGSVWGGTNILESDGLTFPELDLGIKHSTFEYLRDELLRLNKKATVETPFYVNLLERSSSKLERI